MVQFFSMALLGCMLGISAWTDYKRKQVSMLLLGFFAGVGILGQLIWKQESLVSLAAGILPGIIVLGAGRLTKGGIGAGDGWILCVTGIYLGYYKNMQLFFTALIFSAIVGAVLIVAKKANRKTELAFVPFLLAAYMGMLLSVL